MQLSFKYICSSTYLVQLSEFSSYFIFFFVNFCMFALTWFLAAAWRVPVKLYAMHLCPKLLCNSFACDSSKFYHLQSICAFWDFVKCLLNNNLQNPLFLPLNGHVTTDAGGENLSKTRQKKMDTHFSFAVQLY